MNALATPDKLSPTPYASIAAVERDTGLSKDTLRVWERRYGFPTPLRDHHDERAYPSDQVTQLRLIRRLLDAGHRPGKVVGLGLAELERLSTAKLPPQPPSHESGPQMSRGFSLSDLDVLMSHIKSHDIVALRSAMTEISRTIGLQRFTCDVIAPLNQRVGMEWMGGRLEIFEEHIYTESVSTVLRSALATLSPTTAANAESKPVRTPRVLLATVPKESHGLGLLMAEVFFATEGCDCVSLGVQTPIGDIVRACNAQRIDILALSFTASLNPTLVSASLSELRAQLPASVQIWAGGACPTLHRKPIDGIVAFSSLDAIAAQLNRWRNTHQSS